MLHIAWPCTATAGRPPSRTCYEVLDISPQEQDSKVIEEAALCCSGHVRTYQLTRELESTQRLNEIAHAMSTLLDPVRRREYDLSLATPVRPAVSERGLPTGREPSTVLRARSASPTKREDTLVPLIVAGRTCDVQLSCRRRALRKVRRKSSSPAERKIASIPSPALKGA